MRGVFKLGDDGAVVVDEAEAKSLGLEPRDGMNLKSVKVLVADLLAANPNLLPSSGGGAGTKPIQPKITVDLSRMTESERLQYFMDHPDERDAFLKEAAPKIR